MEADRRPPPPSYRPTANVRLSRRAAVKLGGAAALIAAAGALGGCGLTRRGSSSASPLSDSAYARVDPRKPETFTASLPRPGSDGGPMGILDLPSTPVDVAARWQNVDLLTGRTTEALAYEVQAGGKTYANPVLRVRRGAQVAPRLVNRLNEPTIIHWHGLHVDWRNDGHPSYAVGGGASYDYAFTVQNRAAAYWYHPHPHQLTGKQVYLGLAGFLIVDDDEDARLRQALDLELGVTDIPLVIQDRRFTNAGKLLYVSNAMDRFMGWSGEVILINQAINPTLEVDTRLYRFRVLNGSNARVYQLAAVNGSQRLPMTVIGTDGGLLPQPYQVTELYLGPAERVDLLLDLRAANPGDTAFLKSLPFDPMHAETSGMGGSQGGGGMGGMPGMGGMDGMEMDASEPRLPDGAEFFLLKLAVRNKVAYDLRVPTTLSRVDPIDTAGATARPVTLAASGMRWLINGEQFDMERALFETRGNTTEVWEIANDRASMPHPMHLHGFQFQILERRNSPQQVRLLAVDPQGRLPADLGWKDTAVVWPGETVRIAINFANDFAGEQTYMFHCHNLEHEDGGMMVNYRVGR